MLLEVFLFKLWFFVEVFNPQKHQRCTCWCTRIHGSLLHETWFWGWSGTGVRLLDSVHIVGICFPARGEDCGKMNKELDRDPMPFNRLLFSHHTVKRTSVSCEGQSF